MKYSIICVYHTDPDIVGVRAGTEPVVVNHQTLVETNQGDLRNTKSIIMKPGLWKEDISIMNRISTLCILFTPGCWVHRRYTKATIDTKVRTPFFLSGPKFFFLFDHFTKTTQSWIDVMVTAVRSEQKSFTSENCLGFYNVHESIFKTRNTFSKSVTSNSRLYSLLINLVQSKRKRPVQIKIKVFTRSHLSILKLKTIIDLEWTSILNLSKGNSQNSIGLPGHLRFITLESLSFLQNNAIHVYWIHDLFRRSSYQSHNERFCHEDVLSKTNCNYCLNYTTVQNNYLFFWNFTRYLKCYFIIDIPVADYKSLYPYKYYSKVWGNKGFTVPESNKCPTGESKDKVIKSWRDASQLCKSIGGSLPIIRNRNELDEIIAFLKMSEAMPPVEGLYIGLTRNLKTQVIHRLN